LDYFDKNIANQGNLTNYYIVDVNDFVYNPRISKYAPVGPLKRNTLKKGVMSPLYTILEPKNENLDFLEKYFETSKWYCFMYKIANYGARHDRMNILQNDFMKMPVVLPSTKEQQKIANFLGSVDEWLENLRGQKSSLEEYKKGMMQKIFSAKGQRVPKIRFKDENGKEFGEWEKKMLMELCEIKKGKQLNRSELSKSEGHPVINGGREPSGFTNSWNVSANSVVISEGGNSCGYTNLIKENFWCGGHCYTLKLNKAVELRFVYQKLKFLEKRIMRLRVGSGLPNIQKKDIEKLKLTVPNFLEQQKIAEFLTSLDNLIESKQKQISQAEEWKNGLIQGLFV